MTESLLLVAAAALIDADGRILVQQRPPGKAMAGLWEFPGGKIESGETPEAALTRELAEELGVVPLALQAATFASAPVGNRHLLMPLYLCRHWTGDPEPRHASALKWVTLEDMRVLPMPPADYPLIPLLTRLL